MAEPCSRFRGPERSRSPEAPAKQGLEGIASGRTAHGARSAREVHIEPLHPEVLLGVTGGIAAYRAAELCRLFVRDGLEVQVVMTPAAERFVGATTFAGSPAHRCSPTHRRPAARSTRTSTRPAPPA